ncbi:NAD(P)H-dependent glycerol-3-phosphate dehydrogenase [Kiritimatiella glycovorans]|uniref:Glycerol-3-phosphate dehydrogenase [NAD(P)+] n=1 Tax=Kiritimatiella glycovorans TaxID=1307763 RepID=A0A0G3EJ09_9BACT|nr:NAD(P)H-dependent glycerol-3-phosphate dehydrogenase [Kiritimatiella glycovorans]AKJ65412.1 Glycerol-3-phosphate dehydrogenase [NAD(P)+] [Kiritimatiella glycovorans]
MKACVIGDGGWGTALAMTLASNGHDVTVWGPFEENLRAVREKRENVTFLPGVPVPPEIRWTSSPGEAAAEAGLVLVVVPSRYYRDVILRFRECLPPGSLVVSATKGLDEETYSRMTRVAAELLDGRFVAALSGPTHAEEVARGYPAAAVVAGADHAAVGAIRDAFMNRRFRLYTSEDAAGVEYGGALKNVIALAAGINDGMELGDSAKAALMTRGLVEIARLGEALGARRETFGGLSGMGDLIVTCTSRHSRNRAVGERLGRGEKLSEVMGAMKMVAEGVWTCGAAVSLARSQGIEMPVTEEVRRIVHEGKDPRRAMEDLMGREARNE